MVMRRSQKAPVLGLSADMSKAQEIECLWLCEAPLFSVLSRKAAELDEPGLVRVQLQVELRNRSRRSLRNRFASPRCWNPTTKSSAKRVTIMSPRACVSLHLPDPAVKDVMEVDVREEAAMPILPVASLPRIGPFSILDDPCAQPFLDEAQESFVRNAMLEELHQPS